MSSKDWGENGRLTIRSNEEKEKLRNNFKKKYPHADLKRFKFSVSLNHNDASLAESAIFYQDSNENVLVYNITSKKFLSNPEFTKYLNVLSKKEIKEKILSEKEKLKHNFLKKYPNAELSKFEFDVLVDVNGNVEEYIDFIHDNGLSFSVESNAFKDNPENTQYLYWPREWSNTSDLPSSDLNKNFEIDMDVLPIFVTEKLKFMAYFSEEVNTKYIKIKKPPLVVPEDPDAVAKVAQINREIEAKINSKPYNIVEKINYLNNPYFTAIAASYVITNLCGISVEHFRDKIPRAKSNIVSSIVRFHLAYHLRRFLRTPGKLTKYITAEHMNILQKNTPARKEWRTQYSESKDSIDKFKKKKKKLVIS